MGITAQDLRVLRPLAERYGALANLDVQKERIERYYRTNALEPVRPVVLIDEVPWGEFRDELLVNRCSKELLWLEERLRRTLYQWEHFQVDLVVEPVFRVGKRISSTGIGIEVQDVQIKSTTGAEISAHEYTDQLKTEDDLKKLRIPEITHDREATERRLAQAAEVFAGLMPVEPTGTVFFQNIWDRIAMYRGVEGLLMDLAMRPEFMHETVRRFAEITEAIFRQHVELDLLEPRPLLVHCTPALSRELPAAGYAGRARPKDVWGRCAAQIFGSVSPDMHDEFDLAYNEKLFGECGHVYYGCCEPMDRKIDLLRRRFRNLRKISITPWADPDRAADAMGRDFVMAAKPNPAFVSSPEFNPAPVEAEITRYLEACKRNGTTCEFVLKDISTTSNNPHTLTRWAETVNRVIDRYYK